MMKQRNQVIALVLLIVSWASLWLFYIRVRPAPAPPPQSQPARTSLVDSLLRIRFRRVRAETDALYHYRTKPPPFDAHDNPFRIPGETDAAVITIARGPVSDASQQNVRPPDFAESLLKNALSTVRVGGVVSMHGTIQLTVGGQLHKEGDIITASIPTSKGPFKAVHLKLIQLTEETAVFSLEDSETGSAEYTVHLKEERH
jgi:hypothetical protein